MSAVLVKEQKKWPGAVYIETTILRQLPSYLFNAEMKRLIHLCNILKIRLYIPELAFDEWIVRHRKQALTDWIKRINGGLGIIKDYLGCEIAFKWPDNLDEMISDLKKISAAILEKEGVQLLAIPTIDLDVLISMSLQNIRPFEEKGEKGFRDTIILMSVLEKAKKMSGYYHLLITDDSVYQHKDVKELSNSKGIDLKVVESLPEAIQDLEGFISEFLKEYQDRRISNLRIYLETQKDRIEEYIQQQAVFDPTYLSTRSREYISPLNMKAIKSLELMEFMDITPGELPEKEKEERVEISFSVMGILNVEIVQPQRPDLPKFKIGGESESEGSLAPYLFSYYSSSQEQNLVEVKVPVKIQIQASVLLKAGPIITEEYSDLEFKQLRLE